MSSGALPLARIVTKSDWHVARLDLQKGFEIFAGALVPHLRRMFPGVVLVIVGEGPDRKAIEGMVQE